MGIVVKIVVAVSNLLPHREFLESLLPAGATVSWCASPNDPRFAAEVPDADVLVTARLSGALAATASRLRLVHAPGAGVNGIDLAALPAGVQCANAFGHDRSIAEYVVSNVIALRRGTVQQDAALREGRWLAAAYDPDLPQPATLRGSVVTFLGFGRVGQAVWELLQPFGTHGIAITRSGTVDAGVHSLRWSGDAAELDRALDESDILVIAVPLDDATAGLIGAEQLNRLGAHGLLVNVARADVVDETELYRALRDETIAGASLDVWYRYPQGGSTADPASLPFNELPNTIMTPHSSAITAETFRERAKTIAENIVRLDRCEPLVNVVHSGSDARGAEA